MDPSKKKPDKTTAEMYEEDVDSLFTVPEEEEEEKKEEQPDEVPAKDRQSD